MLEIWYVVLSSSLYQFCLNVGPRVQDGFWPGVIGSGHRNTYKHIKKSSSSELLGLDAGNLVSSIA